MYYTVKNGDTLYVIARKFNKSIQSILAVNPQIHNPNAISIGQRITIPGVDGVKVPDGGAGVSEPGTSGHKPLHILTVTLLNGTNIQGAINIPTNPNIVVTFDKNVINNTVWANNRGSFTLTDSAGRSVPIAITKMSDKVDFTQRQKIYIQPANPLAPGTEYILGISQGLKALNGHTLGETTNGQHVLVRFKTQ